MTYEYNESRGTEQNKAHALYAIATELSRIADALEKIVIPLYRSTYEFERIPPRIMPEKKDK